MNEIVNEFLLAGDKFMSKMYLGQPAFTYTTCGPFSKNKKRILSGFLVLRALNKLVHGVK